MIMLFRFAVYSVLFAWTAVAGDAGSGGWIELRNCRLLQNPSNDGDSFHVLHEGKEYIFRLCFVDCPETSASIPARVKKQAKWWKTSEDKILRMGESAADYTAKMLDKPFSVYTQYKDARGKSRLKRYFAMIRVGKGYLSECLVREGYARVYGYSCDLPDGTSKWTYRKRLEALAKSAVKKRIGK